MVEKRSLRRLEKDVGEADVESADMQIRHQMIALINRLRTCLLVPVSEGCMMDNMYNCHHVPAVSFESLAGIFDKRRVRIELYRKLVSTNQPISI